MLRRLLTAFLTATAFLGLPTGPVAAQDTVAVPVDDARRVAVEAALAGDPATAAILAGHLLQIDPNDAQALFALSTAYLATRRYDAAYETGRKAFRLSGDSTTRYHAARVAAIAAMGAERPMQSQFWLRRAGDNAPTEAERDKIRRQFSYLRYETPFRFQFDASISPSSNVNSGADSAYNVIEGVPLIGILSPDAMALSGFIAQSNLRLSYRLRRSESSETTLNGSYFVKRVWLDEDGKDTAPDFDASRLGVTSATLGVSHLMKVGRKPGTALRFDAGLRDYWQGGDRIYTALTGGAYYTRPLTDRLRFVGQFSIEQRDYADDYGDEGLLGGISTALSYRFDNGSVVTAVAGYSVSDVPGDIFDSTGWNGRISYSPGKPVFGVDLTAAVGVSMTDYADYSMLIFPVPGGRQDETVYFDLEGVFTQVEYAGFSPSVRLRRTITESNVSRYEMSEWSLAVGIRSNF
ncbi:MAG: hypothetical protein CMH12_07080 [Maritimibacter sp.]|nr:hypothetical protein [Maritimibacter sp.]